jgi:hypothetical protein
MLPEKKYLASGSAPESLTPPRGARFSRVRPCSTGVATSSQSRHSACVACRSLAAFRRRSSSGWQRNGGWKCGCSRASPTPECYEARLAGRLEDAVRAGLPLCARSGCPHLPELRALECPIGGPICLSERRAKTHREAALADEEGPLNPKLPAVAFTREEARDQRAPRLLLFVPSRSASGATSVLPNSAQFTGRRDPSPRLGTEGFPQENPGPALEACAGSYHRLLA